MPAKTARRIEPAKSADRSRTEGAHPAFKIEAVDDLEPQRGGVQSIERAFAILEEVARSREGIALAELSKRVGLHNSTTFHLVKTMVSLGYIRQMKTPSATGSAARCSRSRRAPWTRSRW